MGWIGQSGPGWWTVQAANCAHVCGLFCGGEAFAVDSQRGLRVASGLRDRAKETFFDFDVL